MFNYKHCGLNNIYLNNGYTVHQCGNDQGLSIADIHPLLDTIGQYIATKKIRLAANEFKYLRVMLDESPADLSNHFKITADEFIARENGKAPLTDQDDYLIRKFYCDYLKIKKIPLKIDKNRIKTPYFDEITLLLEHSKENKGWRVKHSIN